MKMRTLQFSGRSPRVPARRAVASLSAWSAARIACLALAVVAAPFGRQAFSQAGGDLYVSSGDGVDAWQAAHAGLPRGDLRIGGMVAAGDALFLAVSEGQGGPNGIYQLQADAREARWRLYCKTAGVSYGKPSLLRYHPGDQNLYFRIHHVLYRVRADLDTGCAESELERVLAPDETDQFYELEDMAVVPTSPGRLVLHVGLGKGKGQGATARPEFFLLDANRARAGAPHAALQNLRFRNSFGQILDGKPRTRLLVNRRGQIFYQSAHSGVFRFTPTNPAASDASNALHTLRGTWSKIWDSPNAFTEQRGVTGWIGLAGDDTLYISFERRKTTQISSFFAYDPRDPDGDGMEAWQPFHQTPGYGIATEPMDSGSSVAVAASGRFGVHLIDYSGARSWRLPDHARGLGLSADARKRVALQHATAAGGWLYAIQSLKPDGENRIRRVLRIQADPERLPATSRNLRLERAAYLEASTPAEPVAAAILVDGTNLAAFNRGGQGVLHSERDGRTQTKILAERILDLKAHPTSRGFALATEGGVDWYDSPEARPERRIVHGSDKKRVDVGSSGRIVALLDNRTVALLDERGRVLSIGKDGAAKLERRRSYLEDVAIDDAGERFYVVGFDNKRLPSRKPVQVAFLEAYDHSGAWQWQRFGFAGKDLSQNIADTRLYRVETRTNGEVLVAGESAGSQTVFRYDGQSFEGPVRLQILDFYNALWNTASAHITYAGRFGRDGSFLNGQLTMARLSSGKSNTVRLRDIALDDRGRIYLTGKSFAHLYNREGLQLNGRSLGGYTGGDASLIVTNLEQSHRFGWFTLSPGKPAVDAPGKADAVSAVARTVNGRRRVLLLLAVEPGGAMQVGRAEAGDSEAGEGDWRFVENAVPKAQGGRNPERFAVYQAVFDADANFGGD